MTSWHIVALILAILFLLGTLTFYLYWFSRNFDCQFNPNPWCWSDWQCGGAGASTVTYPAQTLYGCGKDAQGVAYPPRDSKYCTQTTYPNPPGCECVPDANGAVNLSTCFPAWSTDTMQGCATALANYRDGADPTKAAQNCQNT